MLFGEHCSEEIKFLSACLCVGEKVDTKPCTMLQQHEKYSKQIHFRGSLIFANFASHEILCFSQ